MLSILQFYTDIDTLIMIKLYIVSLACRRNNNAIYQMA
jgi:hypothetical protein